MPCLLAASGQNVALVAAMCVFLARALGAGRALGAAWAVLAIPLYALVVGGGPSIVRAAVMGELAVICWLAGRLRSAFDLLLVSAVALVWMSPGVHRSLGFQLSYACVAAMLAWCPPLVSAWQQRGVPRALAAGCATTIVCSVATAPILLLRVGEAPGVGVVTNAVGVPLAALILLCGLSGAALDLALPGAGWLPTQLAGLLANSLTAVAAVGAQLPVVGRQALPLSLALVGGLAAWCHGRAGRRVPPRLLAAALGVLLGWWSLALLAPVTHPPPRAGFVRITFLDVGQGDATLLQAGGRAVLVDTGPADANVAGLVRSRGVRRLDALVLTHDSADHIASLQPALDRLRPRQLFVPASGPSTWPRAVRDRDPVGVCRGDVIALAPARLRVLHPPCDRSAPTITGDGHNDNALVLLVEHGAFGALLSSDAEGVVTAPLVHDQVDVVRIAHHGSRDAGLSRLLSAARPSLAVVSVGAGNPYGHPAPDTLATLASAGVRVRRTDRHGSVVIESGARTMRIATDAPVSLGEGAARDGP